MHCYFYYTTVLIYTQSVVISTMTKRNFGDEKVIISCYTSTHNKSLREVRTGMQGQNLEIGLEAENMEE